VRITIERLRTLVLAAGVLLAVALVVSLGLAKFHNRLNMRELPQHLGIDISQEAKGVTYSHALGAHSQFKIHASRAEQLKNGLVLLHEVQIELFGQDGERLDRIEGNEFEYNEKDGTATAAGPVEITLMRPMVAPAIAPNAAPGHAIKNGNISKPLANAAEQAASGEIHVRTSGVTSNWHTGVTSTEQRVDFTLKQGKGSSIGAMYDSQRGVLVLSSNVEITTARGGEPVHIRAQHAEFTRNDLTSNLTGATAEFSNGEATAATAKILFREDGSAVRLNATNGFTLSSNAGGRLAAPTGVLEFDEHNQPRHGRFEGGVQMESITAARQIHGSSPTAELEFNSNGELSHAHLERGVDFTSTEQSPANDKAPASAKSGAHAVLVRTNRHWNAPVTDVSFREAAPRKVEPASIHGTGGVVLTGETQRGNEEPVPSRLAADDLSGQFGPGSSLLAMTGVGRASFSQTTNTGTTQTATGDRIEAHFAPGGGSAVGTVSAENAQVQSAILDGHVTLVQEHAAKPGTQAQLPLRATAGRAVYEGAGEWLHLTASPRVENGGMQVAADKIDVSQQSGDAFARGSVKATWLNNNSNKPASAGGPASAGSLVSIGGQGPAHAIAQEMEFKRATQVATFTGQARLWQQDNSVAAPVIVIDRNQKTLIARSSDPSNPVRVVLLSASGLNASVPNTSASNTSSGAEKTSTPSVIRVRGSQLTYSDDDRKALIVGGSLGQVIAETSTATSLSDQVELLLAPAGSHAGGQGQVERMTAHGRVVVTTPGRKGTGEQLTYTGATGEYVLTGTAANPPQINDSARGTVTGDALIFHSRDDSVSIEGGGHQARTDTTVHQVDGRKESRK
jgi:lipopolysaccharide export system protein LptA